MNNKQKIILSNSFLVIILILLIWFYNSYLFLEIMSYKFWGSSLLFIPLFTFSKSNSHYFNLVFVITTLLLIYYFRVTIIVYSIKFFRSLKIFGALLQHYTILVFLLLFVSPVFFNNAYFQKALIFNGDYLIYPLIAIILFIIIQKVDVEVFSSVIQEGDEAPIKSKDDDLLDSSNLIASITQDILSRGNNCNAVSFGLFGPWGSGKTSVFNLLESHINEQTSLTPELGFRRLKIIRLNVHKYEKSNKLYLYFFDELLKEIQKLVLLPRLDAFFITKILLLPFIKGIDLDNLLNKIMPLPRIDEYLLKYSSWLVKMDILIICFIDDIDRLINPKDVDAVLKLINLVKHNMSNVILFIAADPAIFNIVIDANNTN